MTIALVLFAYPNQYNVSTFRVSGGQISAWVRLPQASFSPFAAAKAAADDVCAGVKPLPLPAGAGPAQDAANVAVVAQFFYDVDMGDSLTATALFSDAATYASTSPLRAADCQYTCTGKAAILAAVAHDWKQSTYGPPSTPYMVTVEQVCGDTVAVVIVPNAQASNGAAAPVWYVAAFRVSAGQISDLQEDLSQGETLTDAQNLAAQACGGRIPAAPGPFNRGGLLPLETRLTLIMSVMVAGVVATVLLALLLHLGLRLTDRAADDTADG